MIGDPALGDAIGLARLANFFQDSAHNENDIFPIKKFNEPLAFARAPSHSVRARLLCAFAANASGLPGRLRYRQREHLPR